MDKTFRVTILYFQDASAYISKEHEEADSEYNAERRALQKFMQSTAYDWISSVDCEEVKNVGTRPN